MGSIEYVRSVKAHQDRYQRLVPGRSDTGEIWIDWSEYTACNGMRIDTFFQKYQAIGVYDSNGRGIWETLGLVGNGEMGGNEASSSFGFYVRGYTKNTRSERCSNRISFLVFGAVCDMNVSVDITAGQSSIVCFDCYSLKSSS